MGASRPTWNRYWPTPSDYSRLCGTCCRTRSSSRLKAVPWSFARRASARTWKSRSAIPAPASRRSSCHSCSNDFARRKRARDGATGGSGSASRSPVTWPSCTAARSPSTAPEKAKDRRSACSCRLRRRSPIRLPTSSSTGPSTICRCSRRSLQWVVLASSPSLARLGFCDSPISAQPEVPREQLRADDVLARAGPLDRTKNPARGLVERRCGDVAESYRCFHAAIEIRAPAVDRDVARPHRKVLVSLDVAHLQVARVQIDVQIGARRHVDLEMRAATVRRDRPDHGPCALDLHVAVDPLRHASPGGGPSHLDAV